MRDFILFDQIDYGRIRKIWYEEEWYYSTLDIVSVLTNSDFTAARNYYHSFKHRMKRNGDGSFCVKRLKAIARDNKQYRTDFTNLDGLYTLYDYIGNNKKRYIVRTEKRKDDEIANFHPLVIETLQRKGFQIMHHVRLPSGNITDLLAWNEVKMYFIECKPTLTKGKLYSAIGQVMCYCCEYEHLISPAIATYRSNFNNYTKLCCEAMGIEVIQIENQREYNS